MLIYLILLPFATICSITPLSAQIFEKGDAFYTFFWTRSSGEVFNRGYYGLATVDTTVRTKDTTIYPAKFSMYPDTWWKKILSKTTMEMEISVIKGVNKPDRIYQCSKKFDGISWLKSVRGSTDNGSYEILFYFPVLPQEIAYKKYDYFSVEIDSTMILQFHAVTDSIFIGSYINNRKNTNEKSLVYAKNAVSIFTTDKNPLRVKTVQISGEHKNLTASYCQLNLDSLKSGAAYYGFSIIDTVIEDVVFAIRNFSINGDRNIKTDSLYDLNWSITGASYLESCSLHISYNSGHNWIFIDTVNIKATSYKWQTPLQPQPSCVLRMTAKGSNNRKSSVITHEFALVDSTVFIPSSDSPVSNIILDGEVIDSTAVGLFWERPKTDSVDINSIRIMYSKYHFPLSIDESVYTIAGNYPPASGNDTIKKLEPATDYFFSLFVHNRKGLWSDTTGHSRKKLTTGSRNGEPVCIGKDTAFAFDRTVKIWTVEKLLTEYCDTIVQWKGPAVVSGFVSTGSQLDFRIGNFDDDLEVNIEMPYANIPKSLSALNQSIYRFNIYDGQWEINDGRYSIDTLAKTITFSVKGIKYPIVAMIDTQPPKITALFNEKEIININEKIIDTFVVSDNVSNIAVRLYASAGNENYRDLSDYVYNIGDDKYLTSIRYDIADALSGFRGIVVASDGKNCDTVNISKAVLRDKSNVDNFTTKEGEWHPVHVTAIPEMPFFSSVLGFANGNVYNNREELIMRWQPDQSNYRDSSKWVKYSNENDSNFILLPGNLFWIKTKDNRTIDFGRAIVPPLIDTFKMAFYPDEWTDFANPFAFDVGLSEIISAMKVRSGAIFDRIGIYQWSYEKANGTYITKPFYLQDITLEDSVASLVMRKGTIYTVYNDDDAIDTLRIPPVCTSLTHLPKMTPKKSADGKWRIKIRITDEKGTTYSPVYCASAPLSRPSRYYPLSPSFSEIVSGIMDTITGITWGHAATGDLESGGMTFDIMTENRGNRRRSVSLYIDEQEGVPGNMKVGFVTTVPQGKCLINDSQKVMIDPENFHREVLIIGSEEYINSFYRRYTSILSFKPVMRYGKLMLHYSLPYNTRLAIFSIVDLQGRRVIKKVISGKAINTIGKLYIDRDLANAFYIIEMQAMVEGSAQPEIMRKKCICIR